MNHLSSVTGHFADKPTRGQSSYGLVSSWTSQVTNMPEGALTSFTVCDAYGYFAGNTSLMT